MAKGSMVVVQRRQALTTARQSKQLFHICVQQVLPQKIVDSEIANKAMQLVLSIWVFGRWLVNQSMEIFEATTESSVMKQDGVTDEVINELFTSAREAV
jgi:hypothetical protein